MKVETTRFGQIEVDQNRLIVFSMHDKHIGHECSLACLFLHNGTRHSLSMLTTLLIILTFNRINLHYIYFTQS